MEQPEPKAPIGHRNRQGGWGTGRKGRGNRDSLAGRPCQVGRESAQVPFKARYEQNCHVAVIYMRSGGRCAGGLNVWLGLLV